MLPAPPLLHTFRIVGFHPTVHIYAVFRVDPMHVLSLGVSKLLKEFLINMSSNDKRTTISMRKSIGNCKGFDQTTTIVPSEQNTIPRLVAKQSPGFDPPVDASKADRTHTLYSLLDEQSLIGCSRHLISNALTKYHLFRVQ